MMRLAALVLVVGLSAPAAAGTPDGYMTMGGVGSMRCAVLSENVATARQRYGLDTPESWNALNAYVMYFFGYLTAYNALQPGVWDIAAGIRDDHMPTTILTITDRYCSDNPTKQIDDAVWDLIGKLAPTAQTTKP